MGVPFGVKAMRGIAEVSSISVELLFESQVVLDRCLFVEGFVIIEEKGFKWVRVFAAARLVIIIRLIFYRGKGLAGRLTWRAIVTGTISNHSDDVLVDGFVGAGESALLRGRDICVFDCRLVHEVLADVNGYVF